MTCSDFERGLSVHSLGSRSTQSLAGKSVKDLSVGTSESLDFGLWGYRFADRRLGFAVVGKLHE